MTLTPFKTLPVDAIFYLASDLREDVAQPYVKEARTVISEVGSRERLRVSFEDALVVAAADVEEVEQEQEAAEVEVAAVTEKIRVALDAAPSSPLGQLRKKLAGWQAAHAKKPYGARGIAAMVALGLEIAALESAQ
jgi:hypothetical protein